MKSITSAPSKVAGKSVGFPRSIGSDGAESTSRLKFASPTTPPNKPPIKPASKKMAKGRLFVTAVLASILSFLGFTVWNEFGRYRDWGLIESERIELSASQDGWIKQVLVCEGDIVQPGQLLATLDLPKLESERHRIQREIQIAQSNVHLRLAELGSRYRELKSESLDRQVEYHRILSDIGFKKSMLIEAEQTFRSMQSLRITNAISESDFLAAQRQVDGLTIQISELEKSLEPLKHSLDEFAPQDDNELINRERQRIVWLEKEWESLENWSKSSEIRSPIHGRVLKRSVHEGEHVLGGAPVFELADVESVRAVLYVAQYQAPTLKAGDRIQLTIPCLNRSAKFEVERVSPQVEAPPESLKTRYRAFQSLVRVHARLVIDEPVGNPRLDDQELSQWMGAEVAWPHLDMKALAESISKGAE